MAKEYVVGWRIVEVTLSGEETVSSVSENHAMAEVQDRIMAKKNLAKLGLDMESVAVETFINRDAMGEGGND
jgi:hypothetical protein